jgi:predicted HTH transcriptional regulator
MAALREAITNAVMHRDWFMQGAAPAGVYPAHQKRHY